MALAERANEAARDASASASACANLLTQYMVNVEVFKLLCHDNGRVVIGH